MPLIFFYSEIFPATYLTIDGHNMLSQYVFSMRLIVVIERQYPDLPTGLQSTITSFGYLLVTMVTRG